MSRIPQSNAQCTKNDIKESFKDTMSQLVETFRRLATPNVTFPTATQIENISNSPLAPHLLLLSEHVVGSAHANHVRRQLHDLQKSNLPKSIISEVFAKELTFKPNYNSSSTFELEKERTLKLEEEVRSREAELLHANNDIERYRQKHRTLAELTLIASQTQVALEQFQKQIVSPRSNTTSHTIADITRATPGVVSYMEGFLPGQDFNLDLDWSQNISALWTQLLETTCRMVEETNLPTIPELPYEITNVSHTISDLRRVLLVMKASCSHESADINDEFLEGQLQAAEDCPGYPGRETTMEVAKINVRRKILNSISLGQQDTLEDNEARLEELHTRATRLLEAAQALMRETKILAVKLPVEVREEISPIAVQISALKDKLSSSIEVRRMDAHDSVIEHTKGFSQQLCETLGLPPDSSSDVIYDHVRDLLSRSR